MASVDEAGVRAAARLMERAIVLTPDEIRRLAVGYREIVAAEDLRHPLPLGRRSIADGEAAVRSTIGPERTGVIERDATEAIARARADGRVSRIRTLLDWTYGRSAATAIADAALAVEAGWALSEADREILLRPWVQAVGTDPATAIDSRVVPDGPGASARAEPAPHGEGRVLVPAVLGGLVACLGGLIALSAGTGPVLGALAIGFPAAVSGFVVRRRATIGLAVTLGWLLAGLAAGATAITAAVSVAGIVAVPPRSLGDAAIAVLLVGGWLFTVSLLVVSPVASGGLGIGFLLDRRFHQRRLRAGPGG